MTAQDNHRSGVDRRSMDNSDHEKVFYTGPDRRSGNDRRVWIDRMQEINMKLK